MCAFRQQSLLWIYFISGAWQGFDSEFFISSFGLGERNVTTVVEKFSENIYRVSKKNVYTLKIIVNVVIIQNLIISKIIKF